MRMRARPRTRWGLANEQISKLQQLQRKNTEYNIIHNIRLNIMSSSLPSPSTFPAFPFEPYQIQMGFMQELYRCLEDGCVGLLESPTGTVDHVE